MGFETHSLDQGGDTLVMENYLEDRDSFENVAKVESQPINDELVEHLNSLELNGNFSEEVAEVEDDNEFDKEIQVEAEDEPGELKKIENLDDLSKEVSQRLLDDLLSFGKEKVPSRAIEVLEEKLLPVINDIIEENVRKVPDNLAENIDGLIKKVKDNLPKEFGDILEKLNLTSLGDSESREKFIKFSSWALDLVPIVGPAKMMTESMKGKTLDGEDLRGWKRLMHGVEGGAFMALDLVGAGAIQKIAKASSPSAKLLTRGAAYMRKAGVSRDTYSTVYRAGRFLEENKALTKFLDKKVIHLIKLRKIGFKV